MANVVRDPKTHPDAIIPDLSKPDPLVKFTKDDIAFVYGGLWKQRYFTKKGDDYFPLGAQWDVAHQIWRAYQVAPNTDWWVAHYPPDNLQRPTGPLCDGCHSVNYNIQTKTVTEWNVGCEKCHGPGSAHAARVSQTNIVNPANYAAEYVFPGHPDKLCDAIADALVEEAARREKRALCGIEVAVHRASVFITGRIACAGAESIPVEEIARECYRSAGYVDG